MFILILISKHENMDVEDEFAVVLLANKFTPTHTETNTPRRSIVEYIEPKDFDEKIEAYAKLEGENFCYYIRTLVITIGRKISEYDKIDVNLNGERAVSRVHAKLYYNFETQNFELLVMGKNGVYVDQQYIPKDATVSLHKK